MVGATIGRSCHGTEYGGGAGFGGVGGEGGGSVPGSTLDGRRGACTSGVEVGAVAWAVSLRLSSVAAGCLGSSAWADDAHKRAAPTSTGALRRLCIPNSTCWKEGSGEDW